MAGFRHLSPVSGTPDRMKRPDLVSVTTINADGTHHVLHPADVEGRFTRARMIAGSLLLAIYVALPWIPVNGAPALFLDVEMRRFHIFGLTLVPQDLWVLFFGISGVGFGLFLVTSLLGRLWCGWACPYTVFLEQVFRRIERLIDGDATARRRLARAPLDRAKALRRIAKVTLYLLTSTLIAHVFLSYFISLPRLYAFMLSGPLAHPVPFGIVLALTGILHYCFAHFREQFCIILCPYGRLQSALTDDDTLIIGYDEKRGEPRGKASDPNAGSCIDCRRCVQVCPTGIDIRNGLQMECIGCAACVDACDDIMTKLRRPTGLVRYDSHRGFRGQARRIFRPRLIAYGVLGALGLLALGITAFWKAKPFNAELTRMRGPSFYEDPATIRNHFQLRLMNKRNQAVSFHVSLKDAPAGYAISGGSDGITLGAGAEAVRPLVVIVPRGAYTGPVPLTFLITSPPGNSTFTQTVEFLGPNPNLIRNP